jgi:WD40 repeat protein
MATSCWLTPMAATPGGSSRLLWSPTGHKLACTSGLEGNGNILVDPAGQAQEAFIGQAGVMGLFWSPSGETILHQSLDGVLHLTDDSGHALAELGPADRDMGIAQPYGGLKFWSPDGRQLVYRPAEATEMRIYSLDSASERSVPGDYRPLAWALGGKALLVATGYEPPAPEGDPTYQAGLLDLSTGALARVPELDNRRHFWLSPDGTHAAVLIMQNDRCPHLAMLTLPSREFEPIPGSIMCTAPGYVREWLTFSVDGSAIYWISEWAEDVAVVFRANSDGTGFTGIARLESWNVKLSTDLKMVAYEVFDPSTKDVTLYTARIDGSGAREIDRANLGGAVMGFAPAWRPRP